MRKSGRAPPVVVITGASSGIGRAAALELARRGSSLVLTARRRQPLDDVVAACRDLGTKCEAIPGDVSGFDHVRTVADGAVDRLGRIDAWVNNAGVLMFGRIDQSPPASYRRVVEVNLLGYMHGAHCALDVFRRQQHGVLVNVGSLLGAFSARYAAAYVASKHGVEGLAEAVRQETNDLPDVYVCNVLPASVDTPILEHAANYLGRSVTPAGYPLVAAGDVAAAIVACIDRPRPTVVVGRAGKMQQIMRTVAPRSHDRLVASATGAALRRADETATSDGNLFHPTEHGTATTGGWKVRRRARRRAALVAGIVAATTGVLRKAGR